MLKRIARKLKNYLNRRQSMQAFEKEFAAFETKNDGRFELRAKNCFPCLNDNTDHTPFDAHYIYHPAWAARVLAELKPEKHIDIASTLHFCSIVSAFIPTEFYDYRPARLNLHNLQSAPGDLTRLPFADSSVKSLSCMHTIEHVGLGRYGDPIDPKGDLTAIKELKRVTAPGGSLLFVVPTGKPKLMFNAHRIYSFEQIQTYFDGFELKEFALVTDSGEFIRNATKDMADKQEYGCGCYWFIKK